MFMLMAVVDLIIGKYIMPLNVEEKFVISKTPLRIILWVVELILKISIKNNGEVISAAIDKYVYVQNLMKHI